MIFLRYESFKDYLKSYPVTSVIAAICIVYFFILYFIGDPNNVYFAIQHGALWTHPTGNPWNFSEGWRYVSAIFMHASLMHLLQNMMMFIIFAPPLERIMKSGRYALFFLLCGVGGNLISVALNNLFGDPMEIRVAVGASGAIYGLFGAYLFLVIFRRKWLDEGSIKTVYWIVGSGVVFSVIYPSVDFWGHIGGLITGFVLYRLFDRIQLIKRRGS